MRPRGMLLLPLALLLGAASAGAQVGAGPGGGSVPAVAPPDTAIVTLHLPGSGPAPLFRSAGPDSVLFGQEVRVVCGFSSPIDPAVLDSLACETPWAELVASSVTAEDEITLQLRLTRAGPYRLAWAEGPRTGHVFHVVGRLGPADQPAPVRDPRRLGWHLWRFLAAVAIAAALLLLFRKIRRDAGEAELFNDPLPPPAWMQTAVDLCGLFDGGLAARGEGRAFLHELDLVFRRFLAGRYRVKAVEMTPEEIKDALAQRAYPSRYGDRFVDILDRCDLLRFSPGEVATRVCHEHLREVFEAVADVRILARQTVVPAALDVEARRCWNRLEEQVAKREPVGAGGGHV